MDLDVSLLHHVIQLRRPWLDDVMVVASALGAGAFVWWTTALIATVFPARRAAAWRAILAILFTAAIMEGTLKPLFNTPRPFDLIPTLPVIDARPSTSSFPSGHAAMAVVGALSIGQMFPHARWIVFPLAALIAVSRVYVGVHWPSDVLGGAIIGLFCGWFTLGRLWLANGKRALLYSEVSP